MATQHAKLPALGELTDERLAAAAQAAGEPEWLVARRVAAWQQFSITEPPHWRRTDLSKLKPELVAAPQGATQTHLSGTVPAGVVWMPLVEALAQHGELIQRYLGTAIAADTHKFAALHAALWQDGAFLYVPRGVAVEEPLVATFSIGQNAVFPHNLVILEDGASATFVEEYVSEDSSTQRYAAPATELFLGRGSHLRYAPIQTWGMGVYTIGAQVAKVGDDATLEWTAVNLGGTVQHVEAETYLGGRGANVQWMASTFAGAGQHLLTAPWLRHVGQNTEGHMDFKTAIGTNGYAVFDGMIRIEKDSRGTVSRLEDHAIHLGRDARSDSIPGLMIDTNDVAKAGHASTSGEVDEEMLFYMRSRGIPRADAVRLIVAGLFEPVLDRIPSEALRERVLNLVEAKI